MRYSPGDRVVTLHTHSSQLSLTWGNQQIHISFDKTWAHIKTNYVTLRYYHSWNIRKLYTISKLYNSNQTFLSLINLVRCNGTVNTISSFGAKWCVQTDVLSGNHKTSSNTLVRLLSQTIKAPQNRKPLSKWLPHKKVEKDDS